VLNKQQELTNQINASFGVRLLIDQSEKGVKESYTNSGWVLRNKGMRLISFCRGKPCMWLYHNASWVCWSCWFMTGPDGLFDHIPGGAEGDRSSSFKEDVRVIGKLTGYNFLSFSNLNNFLLGSQSRFVFDCSEL